MAPSMLQGERARAEAERMFRRVASQWAMDVLSLRRAGLDVPGGRRVAERAAGGLRRAA